MPPKKSCRAMGGHSTVVEEGNMCSEEDVMLANYLVSIAFLVAFLVPGLGAALVSALSWLLSQLGFVGQAASSLIAVSSKAVAVWQKTPALAQSIIEWKFSGAGFLPVTIVSTVLVSLPGFYLVRNGICAAVQASRAILPASAITGAVEGIEAFVRLDRWLIKLSKSLDPKARFDGSDEVRNKAVYAVYEDARKKVLIEAAKKAFLKRNGLRGGSVANVRDELGRLIDPFSTAAIAPHREVCLESQQCFDTKSLSVALKKSLVNPFTHTHFTREDLVTIVEAFEIHARERGAFFARLPLDYPLVYKSLYGAVDALTE